MVVVYFACFFSIFTIIKMRTSDRIFSLSFAHYFVPYSFFLNSIVAPKIVYFLVHDYSPECFNRCPFLVLRIKIPINRV